MPRPLAIAFALVLATLLAGRGDEVAPMAGFPGADVSLLQAGEAPAPDLPEHDGEASELEASSSEVAAPRAADGGRLLDRGVLVAWPEGVMPRSHTPPPVPRPPIA